MQSSTLSSFIPVAPESHFPIQNLPYGVCRRSDGEDGRICVAIGEHLFDLREGAEAGLFDDCDLLPQEVLLASSLNALMSLGKPAWQQLRARITQLLSADEAELRDDESLRQRALLKQDDVEMLLPVEISDYTDFYSSLEHATNVGTMFRGADNALMPNWRHLPVAYHGRASSVVVSGRDVRRPRGQVLEEGAEAPIFRASRGVDFELEMGFFIGPKSTLGQPIDVGEAEEHIFGLVLVNDWSARDIQKWEYQPLGPFLAKNFATSISPWVVTMDALEPFRVAAPEQQPTPLPYLGDERRQTFDIRLEVALRPEGDPRATTVCVSNFKHLYWTMPQQLAHHTITGCDVRTGDLMASGTISGPEPGSYGSMLELAWKGTRPVALEKGQSRVFLQDGDEVIMSGWCQGEGYRVGFGEVTGVVLPAL